MRCPITSTRGRVQAENSAGPISGSQFTVRKIWALHRGRSRKALVCVVPDDGWLLYRVEWPDIGPSPAANLTRCMDSARAWAERKTLLEDRKNTAARRLNSLNNFWWSASPVRQNREDGLRGAASSDVHTAEVFGEGGRL